ncbi:MAG TPA: hypothetical protein VGB26_01330 [Nitrospiria bacterium]|jgi:tRNA U34 2-thiouridine synthase MnmA/TrmU
MQRTAVALMSGGLDSTLAAKLMLDQGIRVEGLFLSSAWGCDSEVRKVCDELNIPLTIVDKGEAYLDLVRNPKYGYGKNMNPCIDCRIYMFELAKKVLLEKQADFIVTGEVLGQRPMSQRREAMVKIDKESEMGGLILRPLSARHLAPTLPEEKGWVDREKLLGVMGRSRQPQLQLAGRMALKEYGSPAGGCLLTDAEFSLKLRDFFAHNPDVSMNEAKLLRYGRHFRVSEKVKVILGRNREENEALAELADHTMTLFQPLGFPGPVALITGPVDSSQHELVASMVLRYSKKAGRGPYQFSYRKGNGEGNLALEKPLEGPFPLQIHLSSELLSIQG